MNPPAEAPEATCLFCKIISGRASSQMVYQDELASAFRDINPAAPVHVLVIPNRHIASVTEAGPADEALLGHLFTVARLVAQQEGIDQTGYRLVVNNGPHSNQLVYHLHIHVLGGRRMRHPLG